MEKNPPIVKSEQDILTDKINDILSLKESENKKIFQENLMKLFNTQLAIVQDTDVFRKSLEDKIKNEVLTNPEVKDAVLVKLYEVVTKNQSSYFSNITSMIAEATRKETVINNNIQSETPESKKVEITKEEIQQITNAIKFIEDAKKVSDLKEQEENNIVMDMREELNKVLNKEEEDI